MRSKGIALRALVYISLFSAPQLTEAKLNIRAGEYRWSYTVPIEDTEIRITYSSRSTYTGLFGAGWCSGLDYEATDVGLFHCGRRVRKHPDGLKKMLRLRQTLTATSAKIQLIQNHKFKYIQNHLVQITSPTDEVWKFKYNELNNLIFVSIPRNKNITILYDDEYDRVLKVVEESCTEIINYKQSARKRWISYEKSCSGILKAAQHYEMSYALSASGKVYIKNVKLKTLKRSTLIEYSESGEILSINLTNRKEKT